MLILLALTCLGGCAAPSSQKELADVMGSRRYYVKSVQAGRTYQIDVLPVLSPVRPLQPGHKLPVLLVLDGNFLFPAVASMASMLSLGEIPSVLIVGIGYQLDSTLAPGPFLLQYQAKRNHDYTPTVDREFLAQMRATYDRLGASYPAEGMPGGADAFLAFINSELKPFIAARYPDADIGDTTLLGNSLGGLFAMHVLRESPRSFARYIASSPSLWWDGGMVTQGPLELGGAHPRLFLSIGSLESQVEMAAPAERMDALLRSMPADARRYDFQVFAGETHASAVFAAFSRGLREVFREQGHR